MAAEVRPIRTKRDYEAALKEIERLWGAKIGTRDGDRPDVLATLIDAYEADHYPIDPPDPIEAEKERVRWPECFASFGYDFFFCCRFFSFTAGPPPFSSIAAHRTKSKEWPRFH